MEDLSDRDIEDEISQRYFDGVNHVRCGDLGQKRADWGECRVLLEELRRRNFPFDEYLTVIECRVNKFLNAS